MPETLFCYSCRRHHPRELMCRFPTRHGLRWRCRRSIEASLSSVSERDAFGHRQTQINREMVEESVIGAFVPFVARRLQR